MVCPVCGTTEAQVWKEPGRNAIDCTECGHYTISGSVLAVRDANGYKFDVEQTRAWLDGRRKFQDPPLITTQTVCWAA